MAEPKLKLSKAKVLAITNKDFQGNDGTVKCWEIVLQNEEDNTQVLTGQTFKALREDVKQGEVVKDVWVYEDQKGDKTVTKFFFPKPKDQSSGAKGGFNRGPSPEELKLKRQELLARIVGTNLSYAKDVMVASPDFTEEQMFALAKSMNEFSMQELVRLGHPQEKKADE